MYFFVHQALLKLISSIPYVKVFDQLGLRTNVEFDLVENALVCDVARTRNQP